MRTILVLLGFILYFIFFYPAVLAFKHIRKTDPMRSSWLTFKFVRTFLKFELFLSGTRVECEGAENIPDEPVLFVANHRSYYDILSTYSCMKAPVGYIAKKEMGKIPIMVDWMDLMSCIFLDRHNIKEGLKSVLKAAENIKGGVSMVIFPEGTRNKNDDKDIPGEFKEGSLKIAQRAGCMVAPIAIKNTEQVFEAHWPFIKKARVKVTFLKPFYLSDIPEEYKKTPSRYTRMLIEAELKKPQA